jgi:hypothetical protein
MLVRAYYHYPCQGVILFVLSLPDGVGNSQATRPKVIPAKSGHGAKFIFFQQVGKGMDPRLRGDDRYGAGGLFLLGREICVLQWLPE